MRDILITLIVLGAIPYVFSRPYIGILLWAWIGYMNPHRLSYGFAYSFPFALIIAVVTVVSLFTSREKITFKYSPIIFLIIVFIVWMNITTFFALIPDDAWIQWKKVMKIQIMTLISYMVITNRHQLNSLVAVIAFSIGYYGVKGGAFTILTGGNFRVWGPADSFISGNNEVALALIVILPMVRYLQYIASNKWVNYGLILSMILIVFAVLGSYSRGALLAALAMGSMMWLKGNNKLKIGIGVAVIIPFILMFLPQQWFDRMNTIETFEEDQSAMGRINAWYFAYNIAVERPLVGGGFETFDPELFLTYAPDPEDFHDAHSIYFEVLGEQGFIGLALFLSMGTLSYLVAGGIVRKTKKRDDLKWANNLASMLQVSLIGYATGGTFLGLAYFDLYYHIMIMIVVLNNIVNEELLNVGSVVPDENTNSSMGSGVNAANNKFGNRHYTVKAI